LSQSSMHAFFTDERIIQWIKYISWFYCFVLQTIRNVIAQDYATGAIR
jgi:hypothetical protein